MIDDMGQFVQEHEQKAPLFGGAKYERACKRQEIAVSILPYPARQGRTTRRSIGHFNASADVMEFVNSKCAPELARLRNELSGSLHSHAHRSAVCRVESQKAVSPI